MPIHPFEKHKRKECASIPRLDFNFNIWEIRWVLERKKFLSLCSLSCLSARNLSPFLLFGGERHKEKSFGSRERATREVRGGNKNLPSSSSSDSKPQNLIPPSAAFQA